MKREDLKTKTAAELRHQLTEAQAALAKLRFDLADKKLQRTSEISKTKKTVARVLTALRTAK